MSKSHLDNITLLGAGVLGGQIAWHSAFKGKSVTVYDLHEESLVKCRSAQQTYSHIYMQELDASETIIEKTRARLTFTTDLAAAVAEADLVIEAVPEIPAVKTDVYSELAKHLPAHTLIATNSSTLLPSQFSEATGRPEKYCALHFANLVWSLNIAEIMAHRDTADETLLAVTQFAIEIGMVPIPVEKEQNGYVLNTMLVALLNAAQTLVTSGISNPETVDRTHMILHRGCAMGPCGIIDVVGMATAYNILNYWGNETQDKKMLKNAAYIKQRFLDRGKLGLQTGEGYYKYPNPSYQAPDFLDVPDISLAEDVAKMAKII